MTLDWKVSEMTCHCERGIYTAERDAWGVWCLYFRPQHREWPSTGRVELTPDNDQDGDAVGFDSLDACLAYAAAHAARFVPQMKAG
jgi:hypothetical protein